MVFEEGEEIISVHNHSSWIIFARQLVNSNEHPRILIYINSRIIHSQFSLRKDLINHRDINLISFFNSSIIYFTINIYSDNQQTALKYIKNIEINLNNALIMTGNLNIRNNNWDLAYLHHSIYANTLREITDSFSLELSIPITQVLTRYAVNSSDSNLVINLMFLQINSVKFDTHTILLDLQKSFQPHSFIGY